MEKIKAATGEVFTLNGMEFIKFPEVNGEVPVLMKNCPFRSEFGKNNDLRTSTVLKRMQNEVLPKVIEGIGEENLCVVKTDLTTLCGLKNYGVMKSLVSLPTFDFYRANVEIFDKHNPSMWWWLATPESAEPHDAPVWVFCVSPRGRICSDVYCYVCGVRPFFIFKSTIFES